MNKFAANATPIVAERETAKKEKNRVCECSLRPRMYPIEYNEVTIQRDEATKPNSIPRPSTLNAIAILGRICQSVYSMVVPASTVGSMETTRLNLMMPAIKVAPSLRLGERPRRAIGSTAKRDTRAANTGVKLVMVEDMLAADGSKIELGIEIGNDGYDVPVVEA